MATTYIEAVQEYIPGGSEMTDFACIDAYNWLAETPAGLFYGHINNFGIGYAVEITWCATEQFTGHPPYDYFE
jgi:hypothetical protein